MQACMRILGIVALAAMLIPSLASPVRATGAVMDIDLSPSSSAMGGASTAVFWGEATNAWANPALLGYDRGIRWEWQHSQLVPGLSDHVRLDGGTLRLGAWGVGLSFSRSPFGFRKLDYGRSMVVDAGGSEVGSFDSFETADTWGFGVSAAALADAIRGASWSRYGDLSFGMSFKDVVIQLAPASFGGRATGSTQDFGFLARVTPTAFMDRELPVRVDVAYGRSSINSNDERFVFLGEDVGSRPTHQTRDGMAVRVAMDPAAWTRWREAQGVVGRGLGPLVSFGLASDWVGLSQGDTGYGTSGFGGEVVLANVLTGRVGYFEDKLGDRTGTTWGFGLGLPIGDLAGVRYDWASFPQASILPHVTRHGVVAWLDPFAVWNAMRSGDSAPPRRHRHGEPRSA